MILLTGGAGFIGSVLCKYLNSIGEDDILIVDELGSDEKWKNLRGLKFSDYLHKDELFQDENQFLLNRVSAIFHMGACSSTTERDVDFLIKNNWEYSKKLFTLASQNNIPFIYASSAATYGDGALGYEDDHSKISHLRPLNAYGYSKQLFDEWVLNQKRFPKFWIGLKFFNVFGPNEYHKDSMMSLVCKAFSQIEETGEVKLFKSHREEFKDGEQQRDFVYVKDVCRAMINLYQEQNVESGIYNMGTGECNTFKDFVIACFKALDKEPKIQYIDMPNSIRNQYQYFTEANMKKFNDAVPNFTFQKLDDSVRDYVQNYLSKKDRFVTNGSTL